jgi:C4-dicarboxylate transporter DctQ subunit
MPAGRFMRAWDTLERVAVGLLGCAALGIGMWQIFGRYIDPSMGSGWGDEIIVYLIIWALMIVSSQLVRRDAHVRPDVVLRLLPPAAQRWLEMFNCLVALVFCAGLGWYGWSIVETAQLLDERSATGLGFPMWVYDLSLATGGALMGVRYAVRLTRYLWHFDPATMRAGHAIQEAPSGIALPAKP